MDEQSLVKEHFLETLLEYMQNTKDFALEQAPELIQEILRYEIVSTWAWMTTLTVLLAITVGIGYYFWTHPVFDEYGSRDIFSFFGVLVPTMVSCMVFSMLCATVDHAIKIHLAPKYFLIKLIVNLNNK